MAHPEALDPPSRPTPSDLTRLDIVKDLTDQLIDLMLNLRQSGHPGGSRSKVPLMVATALGGAMRWDIRDPGRRYADRFLLCAGHTVPLVYALLAVLSEALRLEHARTRDAACAIDPARTVFWEDLPGFRRRGGLPGHAEMSGKTHFLKFNTGPSGHGLPVAAGQALALKRAGAGSVRVFALEGEGGLTAGAAHEVKNSAWGLGLANLHLLLDWNDFGIDPQRVSDVVPGTPRDWFAPYGWRVHEVRDGEDWAQLLQALDEMTAGSLTATAPAVLFARTRKGRGYLKYDAASHGSPHAPMNAPLFWETKRPFAEKYGVRFEGFGEAAPETQAARVAQTRANLERVVGVLRDDHSLAQWIAGRLLDLAEAVPQALPEHTHAPTSPCDDDTLFDPLTYPPGMWAAPGTLVANKEALGKWGGWINDTCRARYGRPLFLACSADLAHSTSIAGFAGAWGWYDRERNPQGVLLPQEITEFTNAALMVGLASTNLASDPWARFDGFHGACSTYGAFVYLQYGLMRLFSQVAQDSRLKVGKVIWVAGHSGPETADDSRTHFGILEPGVTQLFPDGAVTELHPWEHNEVPVMLAAAMRRPAPIISLHLTRPPIPIPDRRALGLPEAFEAARGAYILREPSSDRPCVGTVIVQGTSTTHGVVSLLPELERRGLNVKIVAALSPQLFAAQEPAYRDRVLCEDDRWNAMCVTNRGLRLMTDWIANETVAAYSLASDWDDRWRTGGTVDEVLDEARVSRSWILRGIERFVAQREARLQRVEAILARARKW
jgi:transketolase